IQRVRSNGQVLNLKIEDESLSSSFVRPPLCNSDTVVSPPEFLPDLKTRK
ncbi:hypothetical protein A2U01_0074658, partial [Trifolium medium]|nr:hypothetical protein [Trifolium medium]